jgi:5-methylcytosine-specific restriction endonuclease McrA
MTERVEVPAAVKRAVLVEAGHRCAIPTCRATTTEIAHIIPWSETQDNSFENLIALCPNCHTRYDVTKEIDRKAMVMYKQNLGLLNSR